MRRLVGLGARDAISKRASACAPVRASIRCIGSPSGPRDTRWERVLTEKQLGTVPTQFISPSPTLSIREHAPSHTLTVPTCSSVAAARPPHLPLCCLLRLRPLSPHLGESTCSGHRGCHIRPSLAADEGALPRVPPTP
uniref:Uncharacterized protein n=1 Tax=Setaria italica TaxID=4555 RepID=K3ZCC1_SETIT